MKFEIPRKIEFWASGSQTFKRKPISIHDSYGPNKGVFVNDLVKPFGKWPLGNFFWGYPGKLTTSTVESKNIKTEPHGF